MLVLFEGAGLLFTAAEARLLLVDLDALDGVTEERADVSCALFAAISRAALSLS